MDILKTELDLFTNIIFKNVKKHNSHSLEEFKSYQVTIEYFYIYITCNCTSSIFCFLQLNFDKGIKLRFD